MNNRIGEYAVRSVYFNLSRICSCLCSVFPSHSNSRLFRICCQSCAICYFSYVSLSPFQQRCACYIHISNFIFRLCVFLESIWHNMHIAQSFAFRSSCVIYIRVLNELFHLFLPFATWQNTSVGTVQTSVWSLAQFFECKKILIGATFPVAASSFFCKLS